MTLLQSIPKVDKVLNWPEIEAVRSLYPRAVLLKAVRTVLDRLRDELRRGNAGPWEVTAQCLAPRILAELAAATGYGLRRVVNGTGIIIHTNLGRAPLPDAARRRLNDIAGSYSNLEYDLERGERGGRGSHLEEILCRLTGAEAALVVNNNAAAVLLALSSLAAGREVLVSRGELVEIGGSFRIPDVMRQSGALLREVGTTNRTHPHDYRTAVAQDTALLLKVHASNFGLVGFTAEVSVRELVAIGREYSVPVMADAGSGTLLPLRELAGIDEPAIRDYIGTGIDLVTFSGDKLLGGAQAGILVGRKKYLEPMKRHPLARALRIDKLTLAALEATLRIYCDERRAVAEIPVLRMLTESAAAVAARARALAKRLRRVIPADAAISLVKGFSQAGGGACPLLELPTTLLAVTKEGVSPVRLEESLRNRDVPVIGRISREQFLLDARTIQDDDLPHLVAAFGSLPSGGEVKKG